MDLKTFAYIARHGVMKELDDIGHKNLENMWSYNPNTDPELAVFTVKIGERFFDVKFEEREINELSPHPLRPGSEL